MFQDYSLIVLLRLTNLAEGRRRMDDACSTVICDVIISKDLECTFLFQLKINRASQIDTH